MAKYQLKDNGLSALMISVLNERHPELDDLYTAAKKAASIAKDATDAAKLAAKEAEAEGVQAESLFAKTKEAAIALADADNGPGNPRGIAGKTVVDYFTGRAEHEGLPKNTGKSYANLCGQTVEALMAGDVDADTVRAWTRPEAQEFFASDDARARTQVKRVAAAMVKGATLDYCTQLKAYLEAFRYQPA